MVGAHRAMFIEALVDLQQWVECQQINNTQITPQCNTLFKCGYSVTDAPRGRIKRIYAIDHINQTTGLEDPSAPLDWCSIVEYRQVNFDDLDYYVSRSLANTISGGFWGWLGGLFTSGFIPYIAWPEVCGGWNKKYTFPPPTDEGLTTAPPLPLGFHYPQTSTDAKGRALSGLWALKGGQIYVAPWIQSTEVMVIEWDGLKRTWTDLDIVDNDPLLKQAVENYVISEHARKYDHDYEAAEAAMEQYKELRSRLMYECEQENQIRESNETSMARGASQVVPTYTNDAQSATASCPSGQTGSPVAYTVPAGTVVSLISVADANSKAQSLALQTAGQQLVCVPTPPSWTNAVQSYTANCTSGSAGQSVTVTVAAGVITSLISQADADAQALSQAQSQAMAKLVCTWTSTAQTFTGLCGDNTTQVTATTPAGQFTSTISRADANQQALTAAQNAALQTCPSSTAFGNTPQTATVKKLCEIINGLGQPTFITVSGSFTVTANLFFATTQAGANTLAFNYALTQANQAATIACEEKGGTI